MKSPTPKIIEKVSPSRSFVKNPAEKVAYQRLRTLELAAKFSNISKACRQSGMDRTSFYEWKRRYETLGIEVLPDLWVPLGNEDHHPWRGRPARASSVFQR